MTGLPLPPLEPLQQAGQGWLFIDYDGTLAEFAATPDRIEANPGVVNLLQRLAVNPNLHMAVISGRRLSHARALLPIPSLILAGNYGVEMRLPDGETISPVAYDSVRPVLDEIHALWQNMIIGRRGFYLEEKGYAVALHARFAEEGEGADVLAAARDQAENLMPDGLLRLQGGRRFLEALPAGADKGRAVQMLLARFPVKDALPVYLGDDDKDEPGFSMMEQVGGMGILVAREDRPTQAHYRLPDPPAVQAWLRQLDALLRPSDD